MQLNQVSQPHDGAGLSVTIMPSSAVPLKQPLAYSMKEVPSDLITVSGFRFLCCSVATTTAVRSPDSS